MSTGEISLLYRLFCDILALSFFIKSLLCFRMIQHTISRDQILMHIMPGQHSMPKNPSHATLTVEGQNPQTLAKEVQRYRFVHHC